MEKPKRQYVAGPGTLLLAALIAFIVGALLHDFRGVAYGVVGGLIWLGALLIAFLLGTVYLSRRLLPLEGAQGWSESFRLLWKNYLSGATNAVLRQKPATTKSASARKRARPTELAPSFKQLGAGFLFSHEAAAILRGNAYSRADGPGLIFLQRGETIGQVFDLRPQVRREAVTANTREGIPVETSATVVFQVRRPAEDAPQPVPDLGDIPYPYDRDAIFDLTYAGSVAGTDDPRPWTEQVAPQAAALLVSEIGRYTLDELLTGGSDTVNQIRADVKLALEEQQRPDQLQTLPRGIQILGVSVGPFSPPDDVARKRLSSWQVEWQNRVAQERLTGDLEAQRLYQQARARAQIENIENLLISIDQMRRQSDAQLHQIVMFRLIEVLEQVSAERLLDASVAQPLVASLAAEASAEMRDVLERSEE